MLVLLPPSETKNPGGAGPALDLGTLPFPTLDPARRVLLDVLPRLSADPVAAAAALKVSASLAAEIAAHNGSLTTAPTAPALDRYTGVLFAALVGTGFTRAERERAGRRLLITSALFGLLEARSPVPAYRLSAGSKLPGVAGIPAHWRPSLAPVLASLQGPVIDLRSGSYAAFAPAPGALTVRVVTVLPDGRRMSVSHDNKSTKGRLARLLATTRAEPTDVAGVIRVLRRGGWTVEQTGPTAIDVPVDLADLHRVGS
ncbi:peroxide stress protein YaaA [Nakamurella sp. YIM 132087]|uniref:Peroxide stress protein YaaA n=1 Tax=Nakamurella alba TaxID=2665158 RepID=A0A7K1FI05_9ACTN|nr:peroxide stress protein YaaA [Nakamurella alba]MTD13710.1 peroxide stress protein YaaA [Nakamurella alba]